MNKLLILTSFLFIFSMKINAYEFSYLYRKQEYRFYFSNEDNNILKVKNVPLNGGNVTYRDINIVEFDVIKHSSYSPDYVYDSSGNFYIGKIYFDSYYKNDLYFLNDLYTSNYGNFKQGFLNYLYNDSRFNSSNYIVYENYELLYNSEGLAVESIVNGVWSGLYDGPDQSGYLYNEKGDLKYINGVSPSFFEIIFNKLMRKFGINLRSIFIRQIFYPLLILIFACVVLRTVIRLAFQAFLIRFYDKKIGQLEKRREKIENA